MKPRRPGSAPIRSGRPPVDRGGFTLIEILVALAILATSLVVLLENVGSSIRLSEVSRDLTVAAIIAQDKMTEMELEGEYVIGEEEGDFEDRYPGYWWRMSVTESMFPNTLQLDLEILWGNPDFPQVLYLTSYVTGDVESAGGGDSEGGGE